LYTRTRLNSIFDPIHYKTVQIVFFDGKTLLVRFGAIPMNDKHSSYTNDAFFTCKSRNLYWRYVYISSEWHQISPKVLINFNGKISYIYSVSDSKIYFDVPIYLVKMVQLRVQFRTTATTHLYQLVVVEIVVISQW